MKIAKEIIDLNPPPFVNLAATQVERKREIVVPPIGFESIAIVPFTNRTRSLMLVRPSPLPCFTASTSKPLPKSLIVR